MSDCKEYWIQPSLVQVHAYVLENKFQNVVY